MTCYNAATLLIAALCDATPAGGLVCDVDGELLTIGGYNRVMEVVNNEFHEANHTRLPR